MAADHYVELLAGVLPNDALCLTAVRGLTVDEALTRFDAFPGGPPALLSACGQASVNAFPDELPLVVAGGIGGWVFLVEDNGFHGTQALGRLSEGTEAATVYWNTNLDSYLGLARDGQVAVYDFVLKGEPPAVLRPYLGGIDFTDAYRMCAQALEVLERITGVRISADWVTRPHRASVIADLARFDGSAAWLEVNAPGLVGTPEVTGFVVARACQAAGVDDFEGDLRARIRAEYRRALELRWERCLVEETEPVQERILLARAHALGAVLAAQAEDPAAAFAGALYNACHADRRGWELLRREVTARLTQAPGV